MAKLGYWEIDAKNQGFIWSDNIYNLFGIPRSDFDPTLQKLINIIHPDDRTNVQRAFQISLTMGASIDTEYRVLRGDNSIMYVHMMGAASCDKEGAVIKVAGYVQDITERKKIENALRENQSLQASIIDSARDAVITVDVDQNIILFNSSAERIFLCKSDDALGKSLDNFIPERYRNIHGKLIEKFGRSGVSLRNMGTIGSLSGLRANGEEFPAEISISQFEYEGKKAFTAIIRDITERKKAEEALISSEARYRLLFARNPLPMMVYDISTFKFVAVNFAALNAYGYSRDEFMSMTVFDIRPDEDINSLKEYLSANPPPERSSVWRHRKKDGTIIDVEIVSHEIEFDGRLSRLVLVNDITDKKKAEQELLNSREQLRSLAAHLQNIREEERSAISREIHDELGQVLTSLKMNLVFIIKKLSKDELKISIPDLRQELDSMSAIIDTTVKRIRKIITELRPEVLDELGLISALEWLANEFRLKSGIDCRLLNSAGDIKVNKNISIAVFRILQEALTNVIRHAGATSVEVKIGKMNNHLEIEIADNGVGFNLKSKSKKTFGILGMKERALILGGDFRVEDTEPSGTRVIVKIPLDVNET